MKHVAAILQREKKYSLEFTTTNVRRGLSICFWEGKELVTMTIAHCGRDVPAVRSCVVLCRWSQPLSVVRVGVLTSLKHWTKPLVRKTG